MIDGTEGGAGAAEVTGGEDGEGGEGGEGGAGGVAQSPEWMTSLPDDLKADPTLGRFKDVEALSRGHLETQKLARSKILLPGEDAAAEDWGKLWDSLGRPENADGYTIPMPELPVDAPAEARRLLAEEYKPFRELAHGIGLTPKQAEALGKFELDRQNASYAKGKAEVDALKARLGADYEPKQLAGQKAFARIFGNDEEALKLAAELDQKVGSARLVEASMRLAEIMAEHRIIDSEDVPGFGEVKDAEAKLAELHKDKSWREKLNAGDATVVAQNKRLTELALSQAVRGLAARTI